MKSIKFVSMFLLLAFALPILACSTDPEPLALSNIPVYTTAKAVTDNNLKGMATGIQTELKKDKTLSNVEAVDYVTGKNTKWEDVQKFYDAELAKSNWETDPKLTSFDPTVKGKGWIRGKQVVIIFFASDPALPDTILVVVLATVVTP